MTAVEKLAQLAASGAVADVQFDASVWIDSAGRRLVRSGVSAEEAAEMLLSSLADEYGIEPENAERVLADAFIAGTIDALYRPDCVSIVEDWRAWRGRASFIASTADALLADLRAAGVLS